MCIVGWIQTGALPIFFRLEPEFGGASEIVFGLFGVEVGKRVVLNIARRIRRRIVERCADTNMFVRPIVLTLLTGHRRGRKKESDHLHTRPFQPVVPCRSEEHTSELQSLMRISYAVFCLKQKTH